MDLLRLYYTLVNGLEEDVWDLALIVKLYKIYISR